MRRSRRLIAACWSPAAPLAAVIVRSDRRGERPPSRHLRRQGYKIVARRERGRLGELDLVAVDRRTIVFVEVKTRRSHDAGHPAEAVGQEKQQRLTRLALAYLKRHDLLEHSGPLRRGGRHLARHGAQAQAIEHYRNAFEAVGRGQMFS